MIGENATAPKFTIPHLHPPRGRPRAACARSSLPARRRCEHVHWQGWGRGPFAGRNLQAWKRQLMEHRRDHFKSRAICKIPEQSRHRPHLLRFNMDAIWVSKSLVINKGKFYFCANWIIGLVENLWENVVLLHFECQTKTKHHPVRIFQCFTSAGFFSFLKQRHPLLWAGESTCLNYKWQPSIHPFQNSASPELSHCGSGRSQPRTAVAGRFKSSWGEINVFVSKAVLFLNSCDVSTSCILQLFIISLKVLYL